MKAVRAGFSSWKSGKYEGEHFDFESPAALFRVLTPKRWELIQILQGTGPLGVRALARALGRECEASHEDAAAMIEVGMVEKTDDGKLSAPRRNPRRLRDEVRSVIARACHAGEGEYAACCAVFGQRNPAHQA